MNAKQRRIAYRKQPKAGTVVSWKSKKTGKVRSGVVVGPSMIWDIKHSESWGQRVKPDTSRVCIHIPGNDVFRVHILVSDLI